MKKVNIYAIIILTIISIITGCSNKTENNTQASGTSTTCYDNRRLNQTTDIAESENGYYMLKAGVGYYIMYISNKTNEPIYLCSKANCVHTDKLGDVLPTCDSYVGDIMPSSITFYNDKIYILQYDKNTYMVSLVEISKDGSERKKVCDFGKAADMTSGLYQYSINNNYVYVTYSPESISETQPSEVFRISMDTQKKEIIFQSTEYDYSNSKLYGNSFIYVKNSMGEGQEYYLCKYDFVDKKEVIIATDKILSYTINNRTNSVLYWVSEKGMMSYELDSGKTKQLMEADDSNRYVWIACNGEYIFVDNLLNLNYYDADYPHTLEILDVNDGTSLSKIKFDLKHQYMQFCGVDKLIMQSFSESGPKYYYLPITDIEAGKELEWKMFEE